MQNNLITLVWLKLELKMKYIENKMRHILYVFLYYYYYIY